MLATYLAKTAWAGAWMPALAGRLKLPGAGLAHAQHARRARAAGEADEARLRFEQEARAAARAWLMV